MDLINLDINLRTIIIQWISTLIIFLVATRFFVRPMKSFLEKRQALIQAGFNEAEIAKNEAATTKEEMDLELAKFKAESHQLMEEVSSKAQVKSDAIIEIAKRQAEQVLNKAEEKINRDREAMIREAEREIKDITTKATEKLIRKEIDEKAHDDLFDEFVKLVGGDHE